MKSAMDSVEIWYAAVCTHGYFCRFATGHLDYENIEPTSVPIHHVMIPEITDRRDWADTA